MPNSQYCIYGHRLLKVRNFGGKKCNIWDIERMECALSETGSKSFQAMGKGISIRSPIMQLIVNELVHVQHHAFADSLSIVDKRVKEYEG